MVFHEFFIYMECIVGVEGGDVEMYCFDCGDFWLMLVFFRNVLILVMIMTLVIYYWSPDLVVIGNGGRRWSEVVDGWS